jgi:hypothetical protein
MCVTPPPIAADQQNSPKKVQAVMLSQIGWYAEGLAIRQRGDLSQAEQAALQ